MNDFTERTWTLVTIAEAIKVLMATYVTHPPRKLQSEGYTGHRELVSDRGPGAVPGADSRGEPG